MIALGVTLALAASPTPACGLAAGEHTITAGEQTRAYLVERPATLAPDAPVVFIWHGWGADRASILRAFRDLAPDGALLVSAQGLPRTFPGLKGTRDGWQVRAGEYHDRDLALFDALYGVLTQSHCSDLKHVYSVGFSNGAFFSNLLACRRGDKLHGIVPVAGGGPFEKTCHPALPTLLLHGRADPVVAFSRAEATAETWAASVRCRDTVAIPDDGCAVSPGCDAHLEMCVHPGKHTFPASLRPRVRAFLHELARR